MYKGAESNRDLTVILDIRISSMRMKVVEACDSVAGGFSYMM